MPKASVIIPIYNVENYVKKTIESVLCQTEPEIEIILVDDGSTDGSGRICDDYARKDERIRVIHKPNGGLSSARNAGAEAASADYVMFLDGDDYLKSNAVERAYETMQEYPSDFVQFLYREVEDGQNPAAQQESQPIYRAHTAKELFENLYRLGGVAASGATKLFRRELILQIPFENIRHEDEMWCTRAFQRDLTVTYLPEELYYYVMRSGSIIHSRFNRKKMDIFSVSEERIKALEKAGLDDLMGQEYAKVFGNILRLYNEARNAGDRAAVSELREIFAKQRDGIRQYARLSRKFQLLFRLMCRNFTTIDIYRMYWRMKGD